MKGRKNMNLGNKIMSLRKKNNLSQEELAEKVGVTRQTISKWELEETAPDINQAVILSKIFKVSLDDLTNNDVSNVLVEKVPFEPHSQIQSHIGYFFSLVFS